MTLMNYMKNVRVNDMQFKEACKTCTNSNCSLYKKYKEYKELKKPSCQSKTCLDVYVKKIANLK